MPGKNGTMTAGELADSLRALIPRDASLFAYISAGEVRIQAEWTDKATADEEELAVGGKPYSVRVAAFSYDVQTGVIR